MQLDTFAAMLIMLSNKLLFCSGSGKLKGVTLRQMSFSLTQDILEGERSKDSRGMKGLNNSHDL